MVKRGAYLLRGVQHEESFAEAGGESGLGLLHALLRAGHFGGVPANEVVHGLVGSEPGHWGQHAEGIGGQEDEILGVTAHARDFGVGHEIDGVGETRVLRDADVLEVHRARLEYACVVESMCVL